MASTPPPPAAAFTLLLLLLPLALVAAQPPPPPPTPPPPPAQGANGSSTNTSDAAALHAVFKQWGLEVAPDPCKKHVWFQSFEKNASINCSCPDSNKECRITHLNVTGYRNITHIPVELFNLTELVSLDLSNNNLSGSIAPDVANLTKLKIWRFNNNQLSGRFPNNLSSLRNIQSLWMFDNYIDGPVPEFIANFTNLTDLRIYGMKLRGPIPNKFSNLINLENLMLGDLDGGNCSFNFMENLTHLSTLSLRKCGISDQLPSTLPSLSKLKYLDLRSNNIPGSIQPLLQLKGYIYVGENNLSDHLRPEIVQQSLALDVSYNPFLSGSLDKDPAGPRKPINYIGTSIDASRASDSENTLLNCFQMVGCNRSYLTKNLSSFAVNCGGKQQIYPDPLMVFYEDSVDLQPAGFHVNTSSQWVVSHVGSDPFVSSPGIVNTTQEFSGTKMPELYKTARTSRSALWYYVVGLASGNYTVQLFFAEIVINEPGRRLFNIDIQDQNIRTDFDISKEAGGFNKATNITYEGAYVNNSMLKIYLYWNGRGTCCIPYEGAYGPLVSAIRVFPSPSPEAKASPPPPHLARQDEKRRGVVAGIAVLCIAATVISSSVVYLWWKWISLMKHPKA